jgi:transposase-like protein
VCRQCRYQASVTAGTIFQDTRKPLVLWFRAIWLVTSQKNGASAIAVRDALGLGSYSTAWTWLHKLRRAMVRPGRERLSGRVEVDEAFVGGEEAGVDGRQTETKSIVLIAAEEDGRGIGRIRLSRAPDATRKSLHRFIEQVIEPGATVHTDGLPAYRGLEEHGYRHDVTVLITQKDKDAALRLLPRVHRIAGLLKRWLLGTHQGAVSPAYLDYYLDEYTFRFNRRKSRSRGKLFYRLLQQAVQVDPAPYQSIIDGTSKHNI